MRTVFDAEGEIREVDPLAALVTCWREKSSGTLRFHRGAASAGFDLESGDFVAVSSSDPRFETSAILVRAGKLDAAAVERLASPGGDAALAALQSGILTRREWKWGEKIRAIEVLSDLLSWNDGRYRFDRTESPAAGELRIPVPRLLLELFLRSRDRAFIEHQLGHPDQALVRGEHFDREFPTFGLTADAESVVRLIDGRSTAGEIAERAPADEFAVRKLLAALVTLGLIHPVPSPAMRAAETLPAEPPPELFEADEAEERIEPPPAFPEADETPESSPASEEPEPAPHEEEAASSGPDLEIDREAPPQEAPEVPREASRAEPPIVPEALEAPVVELEPAATALESRLDRFDPATRESPAWDGDAHTPRREAEDVWGSAADRPLEPEPEQIPAPAPRRAGVLVWALVALVVVVGGVVLIRSRQAAPGSGSVRDAALTAAPPPVTFPPPVTAARLESASPRPAASAAPRQSPAAVVPKPSSPPAAAALPKPTSPPASAASDAAPAAAASSTSREAWARRAARDRRRLENDRRVRYSIQLELLCEVPSLVEAWRHDRGSSLWLLPVSHEGRDCFRVFWGRYRTLEAARRAKSGIPGYFVTPRNRPAVVGVR